MTIHFSRNLHAKGQGLVEYALLLAFIIIVVFAALYFFGPSLGGVYSGITSSMPSVCEHSGESVTIGNAGVCSSMGTDYGCTSTYDSATQVCTFH